MVRRLSCLAALAASAAVIIPALAPSLGQLQARAALQVVASGLVNPRGLTFGPEGGLYVAEAGSGGSGPCFVNGAGETVCYGDTGAVTRITLGALPTSTRIVTGLPSLAPAGGAQATGPHDVEFQGRGNGYVTIGLGDNPAERTLLGAAGTRLGRLVRFQPNGKWSIQEDLAGFEAFANPDRFVPDSNPYGVLALPGRQVYTDAGGNSLNAVAANGSISNLAVFPSRVVPNPFAPPGATVTMQAVPTSVAIGPDGAFYVGQLTGFPFPAGGASVYRVPANGGEPEVFATGLTKIIDLAFAPDGSLYVLEITAAGGPPPALGAGALIRVSPDGKTLTTVVGPGEGLVAPGGIAIDKDGSIYITNNSVSPTLGTVVKIVP
jgi:hypothetical protein